tara:strand:+ start:29 stop:220 length:192 start_codon:yes stop_codon:yes gene_type:complete
MKLAFLVLYALVIILIALYLLDKYISNKMVSTNNEPSPSWYEEAARRYGAEYVAVKLMDGENE